MDSCPCLSVGRVRRNDKKFFIFSVWIPDVEWLRLRLEDDNYKKGRMPYQNLSLITFNFSLVSRMDFGDDFGQFVQPVACPSHSLHSVAGKQVGVVEFDIFLPYLKSWEKFDDRF